MKLKRILKCLILGVVITRLSFALEISQELDRVIKESELKILSNKGNVLILERGEMLIKLSPIDYVTIDKLNKEGIYLDAYGSKMEYKGYNYGTLLIPINSIDSNIVYELLNPITLPVREWNNKYLDNLISSYILIVNNGTKLKSEYSSLLFENKEKIEEKEKLDKQERERKEKLEKSFGKFDGILNLPNNIKNYISLSNEISFDRISKRNEFWIDSDSEKYVSGKVTLRDENKNLYMEQEFKKGLPHGKFRSYNEKNFKIMVEGQYEKGQKEGKWTYYYDNGNKKQIEKYENGKLSGDFISYYKNKEKKSEGKYENGEKEGKWIYYYENGEKEEEGKYENDKKVKKWKYFNTNGKLREEKKHSFTLF